MGLHLDGFALAVLGVWRVTHLLNAEDGAWELLAHLRRGSLQVAPGDAVASGDVVGRCGNSGNSTQPHVHVQVTDSVDWASAQGLPMLFRRPVGSGGAWMPGESEVVVVP